MLKTGQRLAIYIKDCSCLKEIIFNDMFKIIPLLGFHVQSGSQSITRKKCNRSSLRDLTAYVELKNQLFIKNNFLILMFYQRLSKYTIPYHIIDFFLFYSQLLFKKSKTVFTSNLNLINNTDYSKTLCVAKRLHYTME